jgi:outer membrane PBP1 activator LpoA protein
LVFIFCFVAITACDPSIYSPSSSPSSSPTISAGEYARRGNHTAAARAYRKLATEASGIQRDKYLLEAAQQWFEVEQFQNAQYDLASIRTLLDGESQVRKILLQTRVLLELEQPSQALTSINTLDPQSSSDIARPYFGLKGLALFELGRIAQGTKQFLMRERFLRNRAELDNNRQRLWDALEEKSLMGFQEAYDPEDSLLAGWITLAEAMANAPSVRAQKIILNAWSKDYPSHPAYEVALRNLDSGDDQFAGGVHSLGTINSVGVLLPLSGRLAKAGTVIRQGIEAANRRQSSPLRVSFHDTGPGALGAYSEAMGQRVDALIGPLNKNNILELSSRLGETPTLALNRIDSGFDFGGLLQFGLAPEDEAINAAHFALAEGYTQAVTLTPSNEWGQRVLQSFNQAFTSGGGSIMEEATYATRDNDHSLAITNMLNVDESKQRFQQVRYLLGNEIEFDARRRQDTDFIFLAATSSQGRLIRPQLKFHYASRIPVFATSNIFEADPIRNKDIDGVQLPISDWVIDPVGRDALLADGLNISEETPASSQVLQLFSLGFDALGYLVHLSIDPETPFAGLSGELSIDDYGVIHRSLSLGAISGGTIQKTRNKLEAHEILTIEEIQEIPAVQ